MMHVRNGGAGGAPRDGGTAPGAPGEWLTAREAAEYLRLPSVKALYQVVARGQVKASRLGVNSTPI